VSFRFVARLSVLVFSLRIRLAFVGSILQVSFFEQGGGAHINADYKGEDTGGAFAPIKVDAGSLI
jgi:hypothetical protein